MILTRLKTLVKRIEKHIHKLKRERYKHKNNELVIQYYNGIISSKKEILKELKKIIKEFTITE